MVGLSICVWYVRVGLVERCYVWYVDGRFECVSGIWGWLLSRYAVDKVNCSIGFGCDYGMLRGLILAQYLVVITAFWWFGFQLSLRLIMLLVFWNCILLLFKCLTLVSWAHGGLSPLFSPDMTHKIVLVYIFRLEQWSCCLVPHKRTGVVGHLSVGC